MAATTLPQISMAYPAGAPLLPFEAKGAWSATKPIRTILVAAIRSSVCAPACADARLLSRTAQRIVRQILDGDVLAARPAPSATDVENGALAPRVRRRTGAPAITPVTRARRSDGKRPAHRRR